MKAYISTTARTKKTSLDQCDIYDINDNYDICYSHAINDSYDICYNHDITYGFGNQSQLWQLW